MAGLTRGSLPPSVYWRRRLFALGLFAAVVLLVGGVARGLTGGDPDPEQGPDVAEQAAGEPTASSAPSPSPQSTRPAGKKAKQTTSPSPTPLPGPQGECSPADIVAEPVVGNPVAGRDVAIIVKLRTELSPACTFELSPTSFTMKITSGDDEIWASRHCPVTIPEQVVVVRRDSYARLSLRWNAKRSDEGCSKLTEWAMPGWYHVAVAALGGEPSEAKFELVKPTAPVVTPSPEPTASASPRPTTTAEPELHETER